jgi:hypothetical protein
VYRLITRAVAAAARRMATDAVNLPVTSSQVFDTRNRNGNMPSDHRPVLTVFEVR